jgi:hypothetical protein
VLVLTSAALIVPVAAIVDSYRQTTVVDARLLASTDAS